MPKDPPLLTDRERQRVKRVSEMLAKGENPYETLSKITLGEDRKFTPVQKPEPTLKQREAAWRSKESPEKSGSRIHVRVRIGEGSKELLCAVCFSPIKTSYVGKLLNGFNHTFDESSENRVRADNSILTVPIINERIYPRMRIVRVCEDCKDFLSEIIEEKNPESQQVYSEATRLGMSRSRRRL